MGISVASSLIISALTPKPKVNRGFEDLSVLKSELGVPLPKIYGTKRVTGNVVWSIPIFRIDGDSGGKGAAPPTPDKYYCSFASMFCEGPVDGIGRIWLNNKLVANASPGTEAEYIAAGGTSEQYNALVTQSNKFLDKYVEIYLGTATQTTSPEMSTEYHPGIETPYRHRCYLMFKRLPLSDYGNVVPKVEVEVIANTIAPTVGQVIQDVLVTKAGFTLDEFDVTGLNADVVNGVSLKQDGQSIREFLEDLQRVYNFTIQEQDGKISFISLDEASPTVIAIPEEALGAREVGTDFPPLYTEEISQDNDLPSQVQIEYDNKNNSYNRGIQSALKAVSTHQNDQNIRTEVVLDDSQAATVATKNLEYYWAQRRQYRDICLTLDFISINVGDTITIPVRGEELQMKVLSKDIGANGIIKLEAVSFDDGIGQIAVNIDSDYGVGLVPLFIGDPTAIAFDLPLLSNSDNEYGVYVSGIKDPAATGFSTSAVFSGVTGTELAQVDTISNLATYGTTFDIMPEASPYVIDKHTVLTVVLAAGQLENVPDLDFYNYTQIGYINGELFSIGNANLVAPNTYELSKLMRGVRGTENAIASHPAGSDFYLVRGATGFVDVEGDITLIGQSVDFKIVPDGDAPIDNPNDTTITVVGNRLKPYSPCNPKLTRLANDDLLLTWYRRTRKDGYWLKATETVPLNEQSESYQVEVYDGDTLLRTATRSTPDYVLSAAEQVNNYGALSNSLTVKIYQMSSVVGRGEPLEVTVNVSRVIS